MHNLFGDRFLRLFAGDLQHRQKRTITNVTDPNPESIADDAAEPIDPASEERHEKNLAESNHLLNEEEHNKKITTELLSERD